MKYQIVLLRLVLEPLQEQSISRDLSKSRVGSHVRTRPRQDGERVVSEAILESREA
jgi:hypothetical protein